MQSWIARFATPEDREDLRYYLTHFRKPTTVASGQLQYSMQTLNDMIEWLPGQVEKLTPNALKQAFYDCMPQRWKERYKEQGRHVIHPMPVGNCCLGCVANPGLYDDFGDSPLRGRLELMCSVAPCRAWEAAQAMRNQKALGLRVGFPGDKSD